MNVQRCRYFHCIGRIAGRRVSDWRDRYNLAVFQNLAGCYDGAGTIF